MALGDARLASMSEPCIEDYTVGWICALQEEYEAACRMLDGEFEGLETSDANDNNTYVFGRISDHYVVIGCLPDGRYGISPATAVARDMIRSFPSLKFALMVGIGGGAPTPERDIRLGDVVVSVPQGKLGGVIQYDCGKRLSNGRFQQMSQLNSPPEVLLGAIPEMRRLHNDPKKPDRISEHLLLMEDMPDCQRPAEDRLYCTDYEHNGGVTCANCTSDGLEKRSHRVTQRAINVHYGIIASANSVMKNAKERDQYAQDPELNILCFEMEAAGLMNNFPCLVIRGICDYSDSHKNDVWHKYAALTAAAYARELLYVLKPRKVMALPSWADKLESVLADVQCDVSSTSKKIDTIINFQQIQGHKHTLDWLSLVSYGPQQSDYIGKRQPGTGQWLLDTVQFHTWRDTCSQTLFCPGIPGAGKTILTSIVVDNLETLFGDDGNVGIAYIYCKFRRQEEQTANELLASLLKQLVQSPRTFPESVKSLYNKHKDKQSRPSLEEISSTLQLVTKLYSRILVLIDALDECRASDGSRQRFLAEVFELQTKSEMNIFATSRPLPEITEIFNGTLSLDIHATQKDVRKYLEGHMVELRPFIQGDQQLQEDIKAGISEVVGGMFLLAQIYLDSLDDKLTINAVRGALEEMKRRKKASGENMHHVLLDAYDTAIKRINGQKPGLRELAMQVLSWITCAQRPLTTSELQHALATKRNKRVLDPGDIPQIGDMVSVCAGLVTVDKQSDLIRLVHYTTQQYFDANRTLFSNAEANITTTCVTYLSFDVYESGFSPTDEELAERTRLKPFYDYSARYWAEHARKTSTLCQEVIDFLESDTKVQLSSQLLMPWKKEDYQIGLTHIYVTGLHLAAYFGIRDYVLVLTSRNPMDQKDGCSRTALLHAAMQGHEAIVEVLLNIADVDARDLDGRTPLSYAAEQGNEAIVELLLDTADVDAGDLNNQTPLSYAAERGHEAIVKLLLDTGEVNVDAGDTKRSRTPLQRAAKLGLEAFLRCHLGPGGRTPLSYAAEKGHNAVVKLLIDTGSLGVDAGDLCGQTPISYAAEEGHEDVVKLFLDTGKVSIEEALSRACKNGHKAVIELILKHSSWHRRNSSFAAGI
ncbi:hypothetical protein BKA56DRAFT_607474 [Ilyonectria sp. MPI-CAGE-AT-0026]|nr:hypothetical protein BKA56DRAFT_607474 [Ilyonectria sp. MPI-CAGE-AT-0026]